MKEGYGKVWIAGAGPGDAQLLTVKVMRLMQEVDVVVYDALVSVEILSLIPENKEFIYAGKRSGHHHAPQEEINRILVRKAREGKQVLRLKGGDPFVFGRGGEEAEILAEEGIPFEVVPGISSALAAPAYAGIPVTHRDFVSSFHVVTGHPRKDGSSRIDYDSLVRAGGTLIFLMGITSLGNICRGLLGAGMDPDTAAAVVEKGTCAGQKEIVSTVSRLEEEVKKRKVEMPALILVGEVCRFGKVFDWSRLRPLGGRQFLVTRPAENKGNLADTLRALGAQVVEMPTIKVQPICGDERFTKAIEEIRYGKSSQEWLVFTSPIGVRTFFQKMKEQRIDVRSLFGIKKELRVAAIGSGTAAALEDAGIFADLVPEVYCARALGEAIARKASKGSHVTVMRAEEGSKELLPPLEEKGIITADIPIYRTEYVVREEFHTRVRQMLLEGAFDGGTFTSGSTVRGFVNAVGMEACSKICAVCIGEQTQEEALRYGMQTVTAKEASMDSMVQAVLDRFAKE